MLNYLTYLWNQSRDLLVRRKAETITIEEPQEIQENITQESYDALKEIEVIIEALLKAKYQLQAGPVLFGERAVLGERIMGALAVAGRIRYALKQTEIHKK